MRALKLSRSERKAFILHLAITSSLSFFEMLRIAVQNLVLIFLNLTYRNCI
jgi:hypothetical protein